MKYIKQFVPRIPKEPELFGIRDQAQVPHWVADKCDVCNLRFVESPVPIVAIRTHFNTPLFVHQECAERAIVDQR